MRELRRFTDASPISMCIKSKICPLIQVSDGNISFYQTPKEKKEALLNYQKKDKYLIIWVGQYSSDVFEVNQDDILDALKNLD